MVNWANAQETPKENFESEVTIDSIIIKATPYKQFEKNGVIYDEDKKIEYYNDIVIYEIKPKAQKSSLNLLETPKPAVFMLPGGGFFGISAEDLIGMIDDTKDNLAKRLVVDLGVKVYVINYLTNPDLQIGATVFPFDECNFIENERGKAKTLLASYKAFHDLRRLLKTEFLDKATIKEIDPNNFFMIGSSAGAVLAINTLFLQQVEIPASITFKNSCTTNTTSTITISSNIKTEYWPIPTMKGIATMAGAWIYDNVSHLTANTPSSSYNTPFYMMHGTCDEIIHRREGRIGFRIFNTNNQNLFPSTRFLSGKGSEYIFNAFKDSHNKMGYGQVLKGGHLIFSNNTAKDNYWDFVPNTGLNSNDPVTTEIKPFIENLINGSSTWATHAKVWNPEQESSICQGFDLQNETICFEYIPVPNISYDNHICNYNNYIASITNLPVSPYTIAWSALGNIQIVGPTNGTSVQYKRSNSSILQGTLRLTLTKGCSSRVFDYKVNITGEDLLDIYMESECYEGGMGSSTRRLPPGNNATFTAQYPNAANHGITSLAWQFKGIPIVFVDEMGNEHLKTMIFSTEEKIDVSKLKAGVYKVVVTYERETFFTSIIKN